MTVDIGEDNDREEGHAENETKMGFNKTAHSFILSGDGTATTVAIGPEDVTSLSIRPQMRLTHKAKVTVKVAYETPTRETRREREEGQR